MPTRAVSRIHEAIIYIAEGTARVNIKYILLHSAHALTADTLINGETPSLKDLTNVVVPDISAEWPALGLQLNITSARLNQIQTDYPRDGRRCCQSVCHRMIVMA